MCKRKLFIVIRSVTSAVLVTVFVYIVALSITETLVTKSRSWNIADNVPSTLKQKARAGREAIFKKRIVQSVGATVNFQSEKECPGEMRSNYCVIRNYYLAVQAGRYKYSETVTLTTQATLNFLPHVEELCKRWKGPISVAVYAPGDDFRNARAEILRLRVCRDRCIREWVTWHFVFDSKHQPPAALLRSMETINSTSLCAIVGFNSTNKSYIAKHRLAYPINVARNVARLGAKTHYVFASDIELYPSLNIIPKFLRMVKRLKSSAVMLGSQRRVFVLPVFEIDKQVEVVPSTKEELRKLYANKLAVSFHRYMCYPCHKIPQLDKWMSTNSSVNKMTIFQTTRRERAHGLGDWEPFFIGTNEDPLFDERLTWNGKANKMQLALEMCYMDYDFHILLDAFIVHIPGIKKYNKTKESPRFPFMKKNRAAFKIIKQDLFEKYGNRTECIRM